MTTHLEGQVWVRQSDGRAVLVVDVHPPDPHFEPDRTAARWFGGPRLSDADVARIRAGSVAVRPVTACEPDEACVDGNPRWHEGVPRGFHRLRGRQSRVRLDRFEGGFSYLVGGWGGGS